MLRFLHLAGAVLLLLSHAVFLARGLRLIRRGKPAPFDRLARNLAQILLPATAVTGFLVLLRHPIPFIPHPLLGLLPLIAIPLVSMGRLFFKKRRELPWLLPVINFIIIIGAGITGIFNTG